MNHIQSNSEYHKPYHLQHNLVKLTHIAISLLNILQHMLSSCGSKDNLTCANHKIVMWLSCDCRGYRPYVIDIIISCNRQWMTLCRHFEWSMEHKYSRAVSNFLSQQCKKTFSPRMHKVSTGLMLTEVNKLGVSACNCLVTVLWLVWSLCGLWLLKLSWLL